MIQVEDNKEILDEVINQSTGLTVRNFPTYNRAWLEDSNTITYGELLKNCCELLGVFGTIIPNASYGVLDTSNSARVQKHTIFTKTYTQKNTIAAATTILCLSTVIRQGRKNNRV